MKVCVKAQSELYNEISNLPPYALGIWVYTAYSEGAGHFTQLPMGWNVVYTY